MLASWRMLTLRELLKRKVELEKGEQAKDGWTERDNMARVEAEAT